MYRGEWYWEQINMWCLHWMQFKPNTKPWLLRHYCKFRHPLLLGACYLLGIRHHLLSACALNTVHNGGGRLNENHGIKSTQHTRWSYWSQKKKSYVALLCNKQSQPTSFMAYKTTIDSKISPIRRMEPCISPRIHISCESQSLWGEWALRTLRWYSPGKHV